MVYFQDSIEEMHSRLHASSLELQTMNRSYTNARNTEHLLLSTPRCTRSTSSITTLRPLDLRTMSPRRR